MVNALVVRIPLPVCFNTELLTETLKSVMALSKSIPVYTRLILMRVAAIPVTDSMSSPTGALLRVKSSGDKLVKSRNSSSKRSRVRYLASSCCSVSAASGAMVATGFSTNANIVRLFVARSWELCLSASFRIKMWKFMLSASKSVRSNCRLIITRVGPKTDMLSMPRPAGPFWSVKSLN